MASTLVSKTSYESSNLSIRAIFPCGVIGNTTDFGSVFLGSTPNKETV